MKDSRLLSIIGLILFLVLSRLVPHPPNFTAVNAIAVFSAFTFRHIGVSSLIIYVGMILSNLILGGHSHLCSVYLSLGVGLLFNRLRIDPLMACPLSSLVFYFVVNFAVWLIDGLYPFTWSGLGCCYLAALPFLVNDIVSTCCYGFVLFYSYSLYNRSSFSLSRFNKRSRDRQSLDQFLAP